MRGSNWMVVDDTADVITKSNPVLDGPILAAATTRAFRLAAVRLARELPQTDGATEAGWEAAQALISLAASKDETAVQQFLRPDPRVDGATWTVACYQIGDLTPCALLDFASAAAAVGNLAGCGDDSHVAAELVASTPSGTRWTALTRTGRIVSFQLPDSRSSSGITREGPGEPSRAFEHWQEQLSRWAATGGEDELVTAAMPPAAGLRPVKVPPAPHGPNPSLKGRPAAPARPSGEVDVEQALELVIQALRTVEARSGPGDQAGDEIRLRLDALDRRMSDFQATVEESLERRIQALAGYTAELTRAFAAQHSATSARLEARLDEVLARLPMPAPAVAIEITAAPESDDPAGTTI